jgi:methylglutamate dehydrogenase subunit B
MASFILCPHCGARPKEEFSIRGTALQRPKADASIEHWVEYVYFRHNPSGRNVEHWHHALGCRRWLVVTRDTATHDIFDCRDVAVYELGRERL